MSETVIKVENLSKLYHLGELHQRTNSFRDRLTSFFRKKRGFKKAENIWALRDVSFEVKRGEVVGVIGRNGAGKSTLLKTLSRITKPTSGYAKIYGRVGSLLEVGTGFHPEFTGRENIYLNGTILGMKKQEVKRKFDEIVAFAEIEKFLNTPVKRYSSGMYVRLAFAVAANLEAEILLVDEVLAVGDVAFQKKCLTKMGEIGKEGRTVLFVSHNMVAVQNLCDRAIWLQDGQIAKSGETSDIISRYLETTSSNLTQQVWGDTATAPGNDQVRLHQVCVRPENGQVSDIITLEMPVLVEIEFWSFVDEVQLDVTLQFCAEQGVIAFNTSSIHTGSVEGRRGLLRYTCRLPGNLLNSGIYWIHLFVLMDRSRIIYRYEEILSFEITEGAGSRRVKGWHGKRPGVIRPMLDWTSEHLGELNGVPLPGYQARISFDLNPPPLAEDPDRFYRSGEK